MKPPPGGVIRRDRKKSVVSPEAVEDGGRPAGGREVGSNRRRPTRRTQNSINGIDVDMRSPGEREQSI